MKFLRMIAVAALAAAILSGCKKDKDEDALSLYGTLSFSMPSQAATSTTSSLPTS